MGNYRWKLAQLGLLCCTTVSLSCQTTKPVVHSPMTITTTKARQAIVHEKIDRALTNRITLNLNTYPQLPGFQTQAVADNGIRYMAIDVTNLASENLISTPDLLPVVNGVASVSLDVPRGELLRLVKITFYDAQKTIIGTQMKSFFRPSPNKEVLVTINWVTTPTADTLAQVYTQNPDLASSLDPDVLQRAVERLVVSKTSPVIEKFPTAIDTAALSQAIVNQGNLPTDIDPTLYKPATIQLKVSGLPANDSVVLTVPFLGQNRQVLANGTHNIPLPPGNWPLQVIVPPNSFGSVPDKANVLLNESFPLTLAMTPDVEIQNGVTTNQAALLNPTQTVSESAPLLRMPTSGEVTTLPNNLMSPMTFSWNANGNDIFLVTLTLPGGKKYRFITTQTEWTPSATLWKSLLSNQIDSGFHLTAAESGSIDIQVSILGGQQSTLNDGNPDNDLVRHASIDTLLRIAPIPVTGSIYYWTTQGGNNIQKVLANANGNTNEAYYGTSTNNGCVGCHALTSPANGTKKIAMAKRPSNSDSLLVMDRAGKTILKELPDGALSAWSPDGTKLVYSTNTPDTSSYFGSQVYTNLRIYDVTTDTDAALNGASDANFNETMPAWSPDGTKIVFARFPRRAPMPITPTFTFPNEPTTMAHGIPLPNQGSHLYMVPATGGAITPLTGTQSDVIQRIYPVFSPDGKWVVFTHRDWTKPLQNISLLTLLSRSFGDLISLAEDSFLHIIPTDGSAPAKPIGPASNGKVDAMARFSPEGNWLAFSSHRLGNSTRAQLLISRFYTATGTTDAPFYLPGPLPDTSNHIPVWDCDSVAECTPPPLDRGNPGRGNTLR